MAQPGWVAPAVSLLQQQEGCSLEAYADPVSGGDPWTIGYGQTGPGICEGVVWTQAQAISALTNRVLSLGNWVVSTVKQPLNDNQVAALISFVYNVGQGNFLQSTLLRLLNAGDWNGAAGQFSRWDLAGGHVVPDLVRRRQAEETLFMSEPA